MGIKYRDNSISGVYAGYDTVYQVILNNNVIWSGDRGDIADWRYAEVDGKKVLFEYIGADPVNIAVPRDNGQTVVNNYTSGDTTAESNTPFYNNPNIISIDLQQVPYVNSSMSNAFAYSSNLTSVKSICQSTTNMRGTFGSCIKFNYEVKLPSTVTDLTSTFFYCTNFNSSIQIPDTITRVPYTFERCSSFNQNIQIPNSVTDLNGTFSYCSSFNQNVQIPDSVKMMQRTFYYCNNFNRNIKLGNSVNTLFQTFYNCSSLNQNIQIPNSVTNMSGTFRNCTNLNQNIQIPNRVTDMFGTFAHCSSLNQNIQIPDSVTNMDDTFRNCNSLNGDIMILSSLVANAARCFSNTSLPKNVYIPYAYENGRHTITFISFKFAGYIDSSGVSTGQDGVTVIDLNSLNN